MKKKSPIGWDGKRLKEMIEESERKFEETGHYYGIKDFDLRDKDPFRYERAYSRLRGGLVSARETAMHVSSSPIVKEIGELCFGLYTPEGDSIAVSTGIMVHVHTMSEAIKFMVRKNYEEKVGINPGDIFLNNDVLCGNVHTADVQTIIPIFWEEELIGWAAGVTHQVDVGGIIPGHTTGAPIQRFDDGVYFTCKKIGSDDEIWEDHLINVRRSVRTPDFWELDEKCRLSGDLLIRDAVIDFVEKEGVDYYKRFVRETIEEGRRVFQERVRERLVPGRYRASSFQGGPREPFRAGGEGDAIANQPIEIKVKEDGGLYLGFDGASGSKRDPSNCGLGAMEGGQWVLLTQCIIHGDKVNDGAFFAVDTNYPEGTWTNPGDLFLSYQAPWVNLIPAYSGMIRCLSHGFYSRGFREEVFTGYGSSGDAPQGTGFYDEGPLEGQRWMLATFELSGEGLGASAVRDGLDWGYVMWNPESDHGDVETLELAEGGIPRLSRRVKPDQAGHGKYRGGTAFETLAMIHRSRDAVFGSGREGTCFFGQGLSGGYPQSTGYRLMARDTNMKDMIEERDEYPLGDDPDSGEFEERIKGDIYRRPTGIALDQRLENFDVVHWTIAGGPGYGDPIERDLKNIKEDLEEGIYTPAIVHKVYGVLAEFDEDKEEWTIDKEATEERREEIRRERKDRSLSFEEFLESERQKILEGQLLEPIKRMYKESLELSDEWGKEFLDFWDLPEGFGFEKK